MKCQNEECNNEATLYFEHNDKIVNYCDDCFLKWKYIMMALGSPTPISNRIEYDSIPKDNKTEKQE